MAKKIVEAYLSNNTDNVKPKGKLKKDSLQKYEEKLGEVHFEDYDENQRILKSVPFISSAIKKTVAYTIGNYTAIAYDREGNENDAANELIKDFHYNISNFDFYLKEVANNLLSFGNNYTEPTVKDNAIVSLVNWHPKYMYVKRDDHGKVEKYNQWFGTVNGNATSFDPDEIIHYIYNKVGDDAYGTSDVHVMMTAIKDKLSLEKSMNTILSRKANAPIHVKCGSDAYPAKAGTTDAIADKLVTLKNKTEFVTNHLIDMGVIGFEGKIIDLAPFITHHDLQLTYGTQVPKVLMGEGNIPEGLAFEQHSSFGMRCQDLRRTIEYIIEEEIYGRILKLNDISGVRVDFKWDILTEYDKMKRIDSLSPLMKPEIGLTSKTKFEVENRIRGLLSLESLDEKDMEEEKKAAVAKDDDEEEESNSNSLTARLAQKLEEGKQVKKKIISPKLRKGYISKPIENEFVEKLTAIFAKAFITIDKDITNAHESFGERALVEVISTAEYDALVKKVEKQLGLATKDAMKVTDDFIAVSYKAGAELSVAKLAAMNDFTMKMRMTTADKDMVKFLQSGGAELVKGASTDLKKKISFEVQQGILNREGIKKIIIRLDKLEIENAQRLEKIARTETSRAITEAEVIGYEKSKVIEGVEWMVAGDRRMCTRCEMMEGKRFTLAESHGKIPLHPLCRCDWAGIRINVKA